MPPVWMKPGAVVRDGRVRQLGQVVEVLGTAVVLRPVKGRGRHWRTDVRCCHRVSDRESLPVLARLASRVWGRRQA